MDEEDGQPSPTVDEERQPSEIKSGSAKVTKATKNEEPDLKEDIGDDALPDLELQDPQDADAAYQPQDKPQYKPFEPMQVSNFQVIRLALTPSCM